MGHLTGLRVFHGGATLSPFITCYCRPLGRENEESFRAILKKDGKQISINISSLGPDPAPWILSLDELHLIQGVGFDHLKALVSMEKKSEFQAKLIDALLLYSKNTIAKEPSEKLVFILVALESLLLKDEREAIQQNVGERLAFVVGQSAKGRRDIVKTVTENRRPVAGLTEAEVYGRAEANLHNSFLRPDLAHER